MFKNIFMNLRFTAEQLFGKEGMFVLSASPAFRYVDGVKTDERIGTRVVGVSPHLGYQKFSVTVDEIFDIDPTEIDQSSPLRATFSDFTGKLYFSAEKKDYLFSCKAKTIEFLNSSSKEGK